MNDIIITIDNKHSINTIKYKIVYVDFTTDRYTTIKDNLTFDSACERLHQLKK